LLIFQKSEKSQIIKPNDISQCLGKMRANQTQNKQKEDIKKKMKAETNKVQTKKII
jgi:hypothetical protein